MQLQEKSEPGLDHCRRTAEFKEARRETEG